MNWILIAVMMTVGAPQPVFVWGSFESEADCDAALIKIAGDGRSMKGYAVACARYEVAP